MYLVGIDKANLELFQPLMSTSYYRQVEDGELYAIGAVDENVAAGILIFGVKKENLFLMHQILVAPSHRKKGIGTALLHWLTTQALDEEAGIFCSFEDKEGEKMQDFLQQAGFEIEDSAIKTYLILVENIFEITALNYAQYKDKVTQITQERTGSWERFYNKRIIQGDEIFRMSYLPSEVPELNLCIKSGSEIVGCILGSQIGNKDFELSYVYIDSKQNMLLLPMLETFRENLIKMVPVDSKLHITAVTKSSIKLIEKLAPEGCDIISRKQAFYNY